MHRFKHTVCWHTVCNCTFYVKFEMKFLYTLWTAEFLIFLRASTYRAFHITISRSALMQKEKILRESPPRTGNSKLVDKLWLMLVIVASCLCCYWTFTFLPSQGTKQIVCHSCAYELKLMKQYHLIKKMNLTTSIEATYFSLRIFVRYALRITLYAVMMRRSFQSLGFTMA